MRKRRRFDREFKRQAVGLASEEGQSLAQVARDLDVRPDMLRRWKKQLESEGERAFPGEGRAVTGHTDVAVSDHGNSA